MIICKRNLEEAPPYVSQEDLAAMKTMVQEVKQDPSILVEYFTLPDGLLIEQSRYLCLQDQVYDKRPRRDYFKEEKAELNAMKTMVQEVKQDPSILLKNFALPDDLLIRQSRNLCLQGQEQLYDKRPKGVNLKAKGSELNTMKTMVHNISKPNSGSLKRNTSTLPHKLLKEQLDVKHSVREDTSLRATKQKSFCSKAA